MNVSISRYVNSKINNQQISEYQLKSSKYTGSPCSVIKKSDGNRIPMMILYKDKLVGFFCLHLKEGPVAFGGYYNSDVLLRALSIDDRYRGQKIALRAMLILPCFVKQNFPQIKRIILAVNHANIPAQKLYYKAGFIDSGQRRIGKLGEQFIFEKELKGLNSRD
ncbi:GNAT family N-acetyltransferase [Agrilactobacillus fermenti]|uniref:GNAT family N-acetyltransferase n=1 Tax=Agrilactobacillus fermenti TaxID=2586909 RepID=UPI003A5C3C69